MNNPFQVGEVIYGYCAGAWGRDSGAYDDKRVEAVGADWIVARRCNWGSELFFFCLTERGLTFEEMKR